MEDGVLIRKEDGGPPLYGVRGSSSVRRTGVLIRKEDRGSSSVRRMGVLVCMEDGGPHL